MNNYCYLNAVGTVSAAGASASESLQTILSGEDSLTLSARTPESEPIPLGVCRAALPSLDGFDSRWQSRNNALALAALEQIAAEANALVERFGADRVGVIIGTSTSGVLETERDMKTAHETGQLPDCFDYRRQEMGQAAEFIAHCLGAKGPVYGVSTACSSGAKALASARRLLRAGVCDALIAGGVDALSELTVGGFSALEAVSQRRCNPFSANRDGINVGEGSALFLLTREPGSIALLGVGEGSDAHHISAPDPEGAGAARVMAAALKDAGLQPEQIGYINLHGTATPLNDQMEARAVNGLFGPQASVSSTKPYTGHALGAAGAIEAAFCWQLLREASKAETELLPHCWDGEPDAELPQVNLVKPGSLARPKYVLSNSFAFGGNNIALVLGRIDEAEV
ncbi:beta-ketoacyl-ACP synthase [Marinobacterium lutimaris]|uniref:3-oxoacyl-[acyl-carrier-protein] synthase-1 n=1 Tax=Marinobacterium lutimaris TaxID=568106 RepID=A0A1H5TC70_9GAMM|nr:beta-ketoacyl-ACP synthase [Marinobacterium lutimaris]SEF60435.1 3-oxoacyl-[acyl-carrier-protein] synthase-1 [Marinobacterium lutimaris]